MLAWIYGEDFGDWPTLGIGPTVLAQADILSYLEIVAEDADLLELKSFANYTMMNLLHEIKLFPEIFCVLAPRYLDDTMDALQNSGISCAINKLMIKKVSRNLTDLLRSEECANLLQKSPQLRKNFNTITSNHILNLEGAMKLIERKTSAGLASLSKTIAENIKPDKV